MVTQEHVYDYVVASVFGCYLRHPATLANRLLGSPSGVEMTAAGLQFTLPALYDFAVANMPAAHAEGVQSYRGFRQNLYSQQTQVQLRAWGGEVVIADNQQQVDQSIYRLQLLIKEGS
ncbi:MAG TPA: hypothetical protein EYQ12_08010 [Oceanospirillaceae bacterium]|nr:hypothetical protein [Oceanospirillaceae bacterium]